MPNPPQTPGNALRSRISGPASAHARALLAAGDNDTWPISGDDPCGPSSSAAHEWATSGAMSLCGEADAAPRWAAGALASAAIGAGRAIEAHAPPATFEGMDWAALLGERAAIFGLDRSGRCTAGGAGRLARTRDGWLAINLPREEDWHLVPAWLEAPDLFSRTTGVGAATEDGDAKWSSTLRAVHDRSAKELVDRARLMGLAVAPAPEGIPTDRPLFTETLTDHRTPPLARRPRVLDLSTLWAGPLAGSLLAAAGLDVIKIESPLRPDGARNGPKAFFDLMNEGKRGAAVDLRSPSDRDRFEALLGEADVVLESARPRALAQLGYDAQSWLAERPGRLWASVTGYGRANEWIAFGDDAAAAAGLCFMPPSEVEDAGGGEAGVSDVPCFCGDAIADPLTGLHVAAVVLAKITSHRGGLLEFSLRDVAAACAALPLAVPDEPIRREAAGDSVLLEGERVSIAAPRARAPRGEAPKLARPSEEMLRSWRTSQC